MLCQMIAELLNREGLIRPRTKISDILVRGFVFGFPFGSYAFRLVVRSRDTGPKKRRGIMVSVEYSKRLFCPTRVPRIALRGPKSLFFKSFKVARHLHDGGPLCVPIASPAPASSQPALGAKAVYAGPALARIRSCRSRG